MYLTGRIRMPLPLLAQPAAVVAAALYAALVLFQLALALGVPWGRAAYGGQHRELPARLRISSAIASVVWTGVALVVLRNADLPVWAPLPDGWLGVAMWVVVALSALAVVLNAITRSRVERAIWLPVSILLLAATAVVALAAA
jgi:hypothetical protein